MMEWQTYQNQSLVSKDVRVQVPLCALNQYNPNQFFSIGDGFGLFIIFTPEQIAAAKKRHYGFGEN